MNKFMRYCKEHGLPNYIKIHENGISIIFRELSIEEESFYTVIANCKPNNQTAVVYDINSSKIPEILQLSKINLSSALELLDESAITYLNTEEFYNALLETGQKYLKLIKNINSYSLISQLEDI